MSTPDGTELVEPGKQRIGVRRDVGDREIILQKCPGEHAVSKQDKTELPGDQGRGRCHVTVPIEGSTEQTEYGNQRGEAKRHNERQVS